MHIYKLSITISVFSGLLVSILSLWLCLRRSSPIYMRSFPIYCWANSVFNLAIIPSLGRNDDVIHNAVIFFTMFETLYFAFFITRIIHWKWMIIATWSMTGLYLCYIGYEGLAKIKTTMVTLPLLESCILIIPFLYYYWELLKRSEMVRLKKEAAVWIVGGSLVYFVVVIPTLSFCTYYHYLLENDKSYEAFAIINFVQVISYSLFIKGMSCKRKA